MMNDEYRGWAWTRAFLGLQADEIHVCGDPSALPLIRNLCNGTGDELLEYEYERFMPLKVAEVIVSSLTTREYLLFFFVPLLFS
jgi:ATP-dependent RNA helicase SUPV3L1/SUV3